MFYRRVRTEPVLRKWGYKKILFVTSLEGAIEYYNFVLFAFYSFSLARIFFPPTTDSTIVTCEAIMVFTIAYIMRPLGGIVIANFGDLLGRQRVYIFSLILMTLATFGIAVTPSYEIAGPIASVVLIVCRCLQGIAIGGQVPGSWTYISERVPRKHLAFSCAVLSAGLTSGILLGCIVALVIQHAMSPEWINAGGWRIPFVLGGVLSVLAIVARKRFRAAYRCDDANPKRWFFASLPIQTIVKNYRRSLTICVLLTWVLSGAVVTTTLLNANYLHRLVGYSETEALLATVFGILGLTIATTPFGILAGRIGPGPVLAGGGMLLGLAALSLVFYDELSLMQLCAFNAVVGTSLGFCGVVPYVLVSSFPVEVRFIGVSFAYNFSYAVFGVLTAVVVFWFAQFYSFVYSGYLCFLAAIAVATGLYLSKEWDRFKHE